MNSAEIVVHGLTAQALSTQKARKSSKQHLRLNFPVKREQSFNVTVCIAAICQEGLSIVLAADRMLTSRDTEFEIPGLSKESNLAPVLKSVPLNRHVIAMTSGNAGFQSDAMQHLYARVNRAGSNPGNSFSSIRVRDVAALYMEFCNEQRRIATDSLLAPYGLTAQSYIDKQQSMSDQFIRWITSQVEDIRNRFGDPVLFCGIDETGAHIFQCDGSNLSSCDSFAFAAIGSGGEHAESQFMLAEHTRYASIAETVLLTYVAKKRSEVAPGVGPKTEIFVIFANPNGWYYVQTHEMERLHTAYLTMEDEQKASLLKAKREIEAYVHQLQEDQAKKPAPPVTPPPVNS